METASDKSPSQTRPSPHVPDDLIQYTFSLLPVKSLLRFKLLSKKWKSLVEEDANFVKQHLESSPRNRNLIAFLPSATEASTSKRARRRRPTEPPKLIISYWERLERPYFHLHISEDLNHTIQEGYELVNSYNGILCLAKCTRDRTTSSFSFGFRFRFFNPALKLMTEAPFVPFKRQEDAQMIGFGHDKINNTYKVVLVAPNWIYKEGDVTDVKVYTMGAENGWRDIEGLPAYPIQTKRNYMADIYHRYMFVKNNVSINGTLNWLIVHNGVPRDVAFPLYQLYATFTLDQLSIISLDLTPETYKQMSLPQTPLADEIMYAREKAHLGILMDCLSFSYYTKGMDHFVVWQMKEFGMEDSWTVLARINLLVRPLSLKKQEHDMLLFGGYKLAPLSMSQNGRVLTLLWKTDTYEGAYFYDCEENKVVHCRKFRGNKCIQWVDDKDYLESLVKPM